MSEFTVKLRKRLPVILLAGFLLLTLAVPFILNNDFLLSVLVESCAMVLLALGFADYARPRPRGGAHGSGLGKVRCVIERTMVWTMSRPTPRPDSDVTVAVVEKPGRNSKSSNSASPSRSATSSVVSPRCATVRRRPRPK